MLTRWLICLFTWTLLGPSLTYAAEPQYSEQLIFPLNNQHNHAPGIVQLKNQDLLVSWYRGSGERTADDVIVFLGSRLKAGETKWSEPFLMADTPGFPDCNTCMFIDQQEKLWLFWPTIVANTWESCFTNYAIATDFAGAGVPKWDKQGVILLKPADFGDEGEKRLDEYLQRIKTPLTDRQKGVIATARVRLHDNCINASAGNRAANRFN